MVKNKNIIVGEFTTYRHRIELVGVVGKVGGDFDASSGTHHMPRITVGLDYAHWPQVLEVLIHETAEFILMVREHRATYGGWTGNSADYFFHFDHQQFARVCADMAEFLAEAEPKLKAVWKSTRKRK